LLASGAVSSFGGVNDTRVMELSDGRDLAWLQVGEERDRPVLSFHGTPGSRLHFAVNQKRVASCGARLIAVDRPGYGHSSFQPGRTLIDWPADVLQLADHLGLDRFAVTGVSGGGPHAAVCAALLPDRVSAAGIISGVGPLETPGAEEGMMPINVGIARVARHWAAPLRPLFAATTAVGRRWPDRTATMMSNQLPPADAAVLERPEVRKLFCDDAAHASATTARAATQDFALFSRDWGFRLDDIRIPVQVWAGDADRNVPISHARAQAEAIPGAEFHEIAGAGHLLVYDQLEAILASLLGEA
jgi:pimeloyl-ACP methyl ester carboxylesterase